MKIPKLRPLLYEDECQEHGKTKFIIEQQDLDPIAKTITFVFYCKKCWQNLGQDCQAWKTTLSIKEYNSYFGFNERSDN